RSRLCTLCWSCPGLVHGAQHSCCCAALDGSMYFHPAMLAQRADSRRCCSLIQARRSIGPLSASEIDAAICTSVGWEPVCSPKGSFALPRLSRAPGATECPPPLGESCPTPGTETRNRVLTGSRGMQAAGIQGQLRRDAIVRQAHARAACVTGNS